MNILLVSELIPYGIIGGLARHCINLGNQLIEMGHTVHLMGNIDFPYDASVDFKGRFIQGFSLNWAVARKIEKHLGIFPYHLYLHFSRHIADAINKIANNYDAVHYHGHYPMVANFILKDTNFIQTRHDYGTFCPNKHFFRFSDKEVCRSSALQDCAFCFKSKIGLLGRHLNKRLISKWREDTSYSISSRKTIFVSERVKNLSLKALGLDMTSNIFVIHNFIDTKAIRSKIQEKAESGNISSIKDNKVMIASTFQSPKGVYTFLMNYRKKGYNFPITVAGRGSELSIMREEFKHYPVAFLGWLSYKDTMRHIFSHQIFVITSLLEEPCPTTVFEAMFLNKPVFALKRGGVPELKVYSRYASQLSLFDSMEELVDGVANYLANQQIQRNVGLADMDFGACVSKKALEIISVYNS